MIPIPPPVWSGLSLVHSFPVGEQVVGLCIYRGAVLVATDKAIYKLFPKNKRKRRRTA